VSKTTVSCVLEADDLLGEGPVWSGREGALYRVDIKRPRLRRYEPGTGAVRDWPLPAEVGSVALRTAGGAVVALRTGLHLLDLGTGGTTRICDPEEDRPENRFNDGKCDRRGRFWAGTMRDDESAPDGALYRLDADRSCTRVLTGVICSNGIGWSPDGGTMYYTDTWTRRIDALEFDPETGELGRRSVFARDDVPGEGVPDGLTVDAEGGVWSAKWDGWRLVRYAPDGSVDRVVPMPVQRPTSVAFGGPDLGTLYVTSARIGLDGAALRQAPLSGGLFALDPGVRGLPEPEYAG
jgi:sugar lactone lactonase YvrE